MIEAGIRYMLDAWRHIEREGPLDVQEDALETWLRDIDARQAPRVWASGCDSWYVNGGHNATIWPGSTARYLWRTRRFDRHSYHPA